MNRKIKRMNKKAEKQMEKEIMEILRTTDYSTYDIAIYYDEIERKVIVPKPVFALSLVDGNVASWLHAKVDSFPGNMVVVA